MLFPISLDYQLCLGLMKPQYPMKMSQSMILVQTQPSQPRGRDLALSRRKSETTKALIRKSPITESSYHAIIDQRLFYEKLVNFNSINCKVLDEWFRYNGLTTYLETIKQEKIYPFELLQFYVNFIFNQDGTPLVTSIVNGKFVTPTTEKLSLWTNVQTQGSWCISSDVWTTYPSSAPWSVFGQPWLIGLIQLDQENRHNCSDSGGIYPLQDAIPQHQPHHR